MTASVLETPKAIHTLYMKVLRTERLREREREDLLRGLSLRRLESLLNSETRSELQKCSLIKASATVDFN